jgi:hypothetical protein
VTDDEILYRRVTYTKHTVKSDGSISSAAFGGDADSEPSVDRAKLRGYDPRNSRTEPSQCIASLVAGDVRAISTSERTIDVKADPLRDNPAHALITAKPPFLNENRAAKNVAKDFRRSLAKRSTWAIAPPTSASPLQREK